MTKPGTMGAVIEIRTQRNDNTNTRLRKQLGGLDLAGVLSARDVYGVLGKTLTDPHL